MLSPNPQTPFSRAPDQKREKEQKTAIETATKEARAEAERATKAQSAAAVQLEQAQKKMADLESRCKAAERTAEEAQTTLTHTRQHLQLCLSKMEKAEEREKEDRRRVKIAELAAARARAEVQVLAQQSGGKSVPPAAPVAAPTPTATPAAAPAAADAPAPTMSKTHRKVMGQLPTRKSLPRIGTSAQKRLDEIAKEQQKLEAQVGEDDSNLFSELSPTKQGARHVAATLTAAAAPTAVKARPGAVLSSDDEDDEGVVVVGGGGGPLEEAPAPKDTLLARRERRLSKPELDEGRLRKLSANTQMLHALLADDAMGLFEDDDEASQNLFATKAPPRQAQSPEAIKAKDTARLLDDLFDCA